MDRSGAFTVTETLREDDVRAVYRGVRTSDLRRVVIKRLGPAPRRRDLEHLRNEYNIGRRLRTRAVVRALSLDLHQGAPTLVLEDGGESLDRVVRDPMELEPFLRLAVRVADALAELHGAGVVHRDLKPENIVIDAATQEVKLADLAKASMVASEQPSAVSPNLIEGSLPYMSPEQTGRTNQAVDRRSDLYSLGITLFELRAGQLPFHAEDPLEWIHCHLARTPPRLADAAPGTPEIVSAIVARMLAKSPEDRYQSARGIQYDLQRCLDALERGHGIEPFALGARDVSDRFQISQRLYGREAEVAALRSAFDRVVERGVPELMLVSGAAGVGKTTVVRELQREIVRERGFFLSGKFDQFQRGIPYSTLSRAFRVLILDLLAEADEQVARWRARLCDALGVNAQLIVDLIPELELLIGNQPAVPALDVDNAERRFRTTFRQFLGAFSRREHPVVLFLDDLQWVEGASLELLRDVLAHGDTRHLLVICAYRSNEVSPSHPLLRTVDLIKREGAAVGTLVLPPLSREHVLGLVADAVRRTPVEAQALAELVHGKTSGNPFFVIQFLNSLDQDHLLRFDSGRQSWRWDLAEIRARGFTDNVVDLMVDRLRKLRPSAREALELAACVGNTFDVETFAYIREHSEERTRGELWEAVRSGLLVRLEDSYRFLHDRVQQAAHSLVPEERRTELHLRIGRALLARTPPERLPERIFEIVNHLDLGASRIDDPAELLRLVELNLAAGRRAKDAAAYGPAAGYLATAAELLPKDAWDRHYALAHALQIERAQCAYANKEFETAETLLALARSRARDRTDLVAAYNLAIRVRTAMGDVPRAIEMATECLRLFGIDVPLHPTDEQFAEEHRRVVAALEGRSIESLVELPHPDRETKALLDVLTTTLAAGYFYDPRFWSVVVCHGVRTSLERGNADSSAISYHGFGMVLGAVFGRYREGYQFGRLSLALLARRNLVAYKAEIAVICGYCLTYWIEPIENVIPYLRVAIQAGEETGDVLFGSYGSTGLIAALISKGDALDDVQLEAEKCLDYVRRARVSRMTNSIESSMLFIQKLRGRGGIDERTLEQKLLEPAAPMESAWYYVQKLQCCFLLGDLAGAADAAEKARPFLWTSRILIQYSDYVFFHGLLLTKQKESSDELREHERMMLRWAESCPANFADRAALLSAEVARLEGRDQAAMLSYERAIHAARTRGFVHNEALACELAGEFHLQHGFDIAARAYFSAARDAYQRWGADAKVADLVRRHPDLAPPPEAWGRSFAARPIELELLSVIKASHTISGEMVLDELVRTLVRVVMEHSGAERGCFVLASDALLTIEASAELAADGVRVELLRSQPLDGSTLLPRSVVRYAARSNQRVLLADATVDPGPFRADEYLVRRRPRSVLCLPIIRRGRAEGFVYLENALVAGAFTEERLAVLELLASQAAISLENAQLLARELRARRSAEEAEQRAAFLAEAGALLAESLELDEVLSRLARATVRYLADWCEFDLVEGQRVRRVAGAHAVAAKQPLLEQLGRLYPPQLDSSRLTARVLRTGEPILIERVTDSVLRSTCVDAEHERLVRELGTKTAMVVPLRARGRHLGTFTLASATRELPYGESDLRLAEDLARRAAMAIDNALLYRQTREAVRLRDDFLRVASHELNTPIASLQIGLQTLMKHCSVPGFSLDVAKQLLELTERQTKRLGRLVGDLLDVTRAEAAGIAVELAEVELAALVRDVVSRFEPELAKAGCRLTIDAPTEVRGRWDRARIEQVVSKLLSNAIKFGAGRPIEVTVTAERARARLVVRDHGIGIEPTRAERVFDRFARGVSAEHYGGMGLGLYIARQIVEAHGGTISFDSEPGAGCAFTMELPVALEAPNASHSR